MEADDKRRSQERKQGYAKVIFIEENILGYLRDFNSKGMKIELLEPREWETGEKKKTAIIPVEEIGIGRIEGTLEVRWKKAQDIYFSVGCRIVNVKDKTSQENYKQLLGYFKTLSSGEAS